MSTCRPTRCRRDSCSACRFDASQGRMFRRGSGTSGLVEVVSRAFAFDIEQVTTVAFAVWWGGTGARPEIPEHGDRRHGGGRSFPARPVPRGKRLSGAYEAQRRKYDAAAENLGSDRGHRSRKSMNRMLESVDRVNGSADDLSQRTNSQAASLEQTRGRHGRDHGKHQAVRPGHPEIQRGRPIRPRRDGAKCR